MVLDRIQFMENILNGIDADTKMKIVRDAFVNVMAYYSLLLPYDTQTTHIEKYSNDFNSMTVKIETDQNTVNKAVSMLTDSDGILFDIYNEHFCAKLSDQGKSWFAVDLCQILNPT